MLMHVALNLTVFSTLVILLAGLFAGYALASQGRGSSKRLDDELKSLRQHNRSLLEALKAQRESQLRLEEQQQRQFSKVSQLSANQDKIAENWMTQDEQRRDEFEDELNALKRAADEAYELSRRERLERGAVEEKLSEAEDVIHELREELDRSMKMGRQLQNQFDAARAELIDQQKQLDDLVRHQASFESLTSGLGEALRLVGTQQEQLDGLRTRHSA